MTQAERFVRRNWVDERNAAAIAVVAGLVAALSGAEPTGSTVIDWLLIVVSVGAVVWASASAQWWAPAEAAGIAAVLAFQPILAVIGAAAFVGSLVIGLRQRVQAELRAVVTAVAMNVLIRSELGGFFGLSAIVGIGVGAAVLVLGLRRRPSKIRRGGWITMASIGGFVGVALLALGWAGVSSRSDLSAGAQLAEQAIATLNAGEYEEAASLFSESSGAFEAADRRLGGPLALPSRLIPGVAQNVRAGADLASSVASATNDAADVLGAIDPSTLTVVDGAVDVAAIGAVETPLLQVEQALVDLRTVSESVASPWLIGPVQDELVDIDRRLDDNEPRLTNAIDAVRLAPQMLGAGGERRYLVLFTTPVEARGRAGFIGNYAEVTVTDGQIEVTEFGRRSDLEAVVGAEGASCDGCPEELLTRYGRFGFNIGRDGGAISTVWANLTFPAHFPYVAEAAQILYPQSGGQPIDGVIVVDPYVIEALMAYTGPIKVPELGVTVTPDNAAKFILEDQYVLAGDDSNPERIDALQTLGEGVIERLLTGSLPEPAFLARDLGPLAAERRLMMWTHDPAEQALLDRTGLLGALPAPGDGAGFSVFVGNTGQSKIDLYLEREVDAQIGTDDAGNRRLVADVTLANTAPASRLPQSVIGNGFGLPVGSSSLFVSFYGPPSLDVVTKNGEPIAVSPLSEAGWMAYGTDVMLLSGESVTYHLEFGLPAGGEGTAELIEWLQPLANREP